jgi:predicted MFS family arabinose efflux permease
VSSGAQVEQQGVNRSAQMALTFAVTLIFFLGFYALLQPQPLYLTEQGLADFEVGLVLGAFGIASLLGRPFAGLAADRFGRRAVIWAGTAFFVTGVLGVLTTASVPLLMLCRVGQALGYAAVTTAATARITDLAPPAERGSAIARFGIAANLAMTITPAAVGLMLGWLTVPGAFVLAAGLGLLSGLLAFFFHGDATHAVAGAGGPLWVLPRAVLTPWLVSLVLGVGFGVWLQYLPLLTQRRGVEPAGLLYAVYGVSIIVTRLVTGRLVDRDNSRGLQTAAFGFFVTGLLLYAFTGTLWTYIPATILVAAGGGILHPLLMARHVTLMPEKMRGRAVSTFYLAFDLGNGIGVWVLGFVLQRYGLAALYAVAAAVAALGLLQSLWPQRVRGKIPLT